MHCPRNVRWKFPAACLLAAAGALGGCVLPVPTNVPLNLPAHGHTYRVRDQANRPVAGEGILVIHTFYNFAEDRIDCYPIREGKAAVPVVYDVRAMPMEMFGYVSLVIPTYYVFLLNGHHARIYPLMPGHVFWEEYDFPSLDRARFIYGVKCRPKVLRMFRAVPREELAILDQVADDMRRLGDGDSREERHNRRQAARIGAYVEARRAALAAEGVSGPDTQPDQAPPPALSAERICTFGLSSSERAFRAIEMGDHATLRRELDRGLDPDSYDKAPWTLLHRAVALGDLDAVRLVVEHGADVNRTLPRIADGWDSFYDYNPADRARLRREAPGYSPLAMAACGGHLNILKYLEAHGGRLVSPRAGFTLMHAAADKLYTIHGDDGPGRRAVIQYLFDRGEDVNALIPRSECCSGRTGTPLEIARARGKTQTAQLLERLGGRPAPTTRPDDE